jgi:hypothetical protein
MTAILTLLRSSRLLLLRLSVILMPSLPSLDDNLFSLCLFSLRLSLSLSLSIRFSSSCFLRSSARGRSCSSSRVHARSRLETLDVDELFGPRKEGTNLYHLSSINREVTYVDFFHPLRRNVKTKASPAVTECDVAKVFLTSKFSYLIFSNPTHKTKTETARLL